MSRGRAKALVLALVAAALAAAVAVVALHRPGQGSLSLPGRPVAVTLALTPVEPQFGDPVVATAEILVDPRRVDPASVRLEESFAPFAVVSSTRSRRSAGGLSVLRVVSRLDCLTAACVPTGATASVRLPALRIRYAGGALRAAWPALRIHARVPASDLDQPTLRVGAPRPATGYRLPPVATGWTLLGLALAAALGGLALLARAALSLLRGRRRATTLELLLEELRAANGDGEGRRRALERLACELEPLDEPLSFESRVLAWAPQEPSAGAVSDLADRVRKVVRR